LEVGDEATAWHRTATWGCRKWLTGKGRKGGGGNGGEFKSLKTPKKMVWADTTVVKPTGNPVFQRFLPEIPKKKKRKDLMIHTTGKKSINLEGGR